MNREQIHANARFAGQVLRYHTWPVHRQQSVGEHTWQVMRIWSELWGPMMSEAVSAFILWHDAGELVTGDLPFPVKARNPDLKSKIDELEDQAVYVMGGPAPSDSAISHEDSVRVKICDLLEMYEFGLCEVQMGNQFAKPIVDDIAASVTDMVGRLLPEDQEKIKSYMSRVRQLICK